MVRRRGRWFAVCCVSESASEVKVVNDFLETTYTNKDGSPSLVIISTLDKNYTEPTKPPTAAFTTPFTKKSASECSKLIRDMITKNESDLNHEFLIILDERSSEDQTALVVNNSNPDAEPRTFRAEFKIVNIVMGAMVAKGLFREYKESADTAPDGVLRF